MSRESADLGDLPSLGVGLLYQPALREFVAASAGLLDYVEVIPDTVWADRGASASPRYVEDIETLAFLSDIARSLPVVPHSIGLSIGSAHRFDRGHLDQIATWHDRFGFAWHSDHLAYSVAEHDEGEVNTGLTLPLPLDEETLELLAGRISEVQARIPAVFLLENSVNFLQPLEGEMAEPLFLNELTARSACGLLLDLHNVYVNARNHGFDAMEFLEALDLAHVVEIHVAGGNEYRGVYLDSHSGPVPSAVWDMLIWTLPRAPNVAGVTFELLGSWYRELGARRLTRELARLGSVWRESREPRASPAGG